MSKRALKKYLDELDQEALKEQVIDLYDRIPQVKTFYDFVFNPKEDTLIEAAKIKISNEYFPTKRKRARKRRSVAQKYIKQFKLLGVDPKLLADLMLFNIEIAQTYSASVLQMPEAFHKSMLTSFKEALQYLSYHQLKEDFGSRIESIIEQSESQKWSNTDLFEEVANDFVD
ncbi:DUF6155 family protein [uncultured Dokdonia sp.]|uniref:DUF6155 family protein n=1 Tax=uncultured Dokdonia sp. TaxID=575653 RepID=UPI0026221AE9|nr:DUF6155 family protein [uncultured Dokdonia sp.]